jgi:DNA-binding transcriptional LysR family regulator
MNLRQLEIFRAVMQTGSTKNAAQLLLISQPAVSNMLRQFEDQLKFKLFERISGRLHATHEADVLYGNSEKIFSNFDAIKNLVEDLRDTQAGTLKILSSPSFGQSVMPQAIAMFLKDRPSVKISFDNISSHENIVDQLNSDQAELALTIMPINHPSINSQILRRGQLVCAIPKGHPLSKKKKIHPRDLRNTRLISYPRFSSIGLVVDEAFREAGEHQQINITVRFCFSACTLVEAGAGIALVDEFTVGGENFSNLEIRPFKSSQQIKVSLSHSRQRPPSRIATAFVEGYLWNGNKEREP